MDSYSRKTRRLFTELMSRADSDMKSNIKTSESRITEEMKRLNRLDVLTTKRYLEKGIILESPNGTRWAVSISDEGELCRTLLEKEDRQCQ